ncbi:MAG: polyprenyl synthetase family protein [Thermoplasmata archaeon]|nr:polyprenyl synthetase family protein [Thermoplasmata archaeon]
MDEILKEKVLRYLDKTSSLIDLELVKLIKSQPQIENLHDAMIYALGLDIDERKQRGKRIRPALCLMTCEDLIGDYSKAIPFALSVELLHNYFLIHDDIEDEDKIRRERPAIWVKYGLAHGINIGDYMNTLIFTAISKSKETGLNDNKIMELINITIDTLEHTGRGQTLDLNARYTDNITYEHYMEIVTEKTGYYLALPIVGGAIIGDAEPNIISSIIAYGKNIGPMFQIIDDVLDLTQGKGRGEIGSDIREGKRSILVAHTSQNCSLGEKKELFHILNKPRDSTSNEDIQYVIQLFNKYESINFSMDQVSKLQHQAELTLQDLPNEFRKHLTFAAEFIGGRNS